MTRDELASRLAAVMNSPDTSLYYAAVNGHCDAFAVAVIEMLAEHGIEAQPEVIGRTRETPDERELDYNSFSHVVVRAFDDTWDINGGDAIEQWTENWIQPGEDEVDEPCQDYFDQKTVSLEELRKLRQEKDGRAIDAQHIKTFRQALDGAELKPAHPRTGPR